MINHESSIRKAFSSHQQPNDIISFIMVYIYKNMLISYIYIYLYTVHMYTYIFPYESLYFPYHFSIPTKSNDTNGKYPFIFHENPISHSPEIPFTPSDRPVRRATPPRDRRDRCDHAP